MTSEVLAVPVITLDVKHILYCTDLVHKIWRCFKFSIKYVFHNNISPIYNEITFFNSSFDYNINDFAKSGECRDIQHKTFIKIYLESI
jgi:hypothetical protein